MTGLVHAPAGALRGASTGAVTAFLGIPYGMAERFAAPRPVPVWEGVRDAGRPGPACPQPPSRLERVMGPGSDLVQDEGCLSLNVWTPGGTGLPVLVWLHGGGFTSGSGAEAWYDGALLAERGRMVVVTVNYRLGALGYLYLSPTFGPANVGLLDQIAALGWVRENIAAFGGDPGRVTLAGQSAGALSALALLGRPAGSCLFQQVVLQSTPTGVPPYSPREAAGIGRRLLDVLGLRSGEADRLRTVQVSRLLAAQGEVARRMAVPFRVTPPFQLVADGGVHADLLAGVPDTVPMLIGTTRDEARAFFPRAPAEVTARLFGTGALLPARRPAFAFRFDWSPPGSAFGACHCIELPFVFGGQDAWRAAPMLAGAESADLRRLTDELHSAWTGFVHAGSPGWSPFPHVRRFT
ncbi:carboxylesterase family protein [Actinomadura citrea]|uniref:Carboxylic ester hydrolase n=1 Tax=Actinomadura citrea TaxID=46158 RepID=A0A7Y9GAY0_9ACTN|nr:carboxylesterase family protein [Actinomadura citrea]NYE13152.1 para-nitrobenzyl esterase [Actinomadura citrea]GGU09841.1 carboxylic ester hydrolase [Actinomadura citrea]